MAKKKNESLEWFTIPKIKAIVVYLFKGLIITIGALIIAVFTADFYTMLYYHIFCPEKFGFLSNLFCGLNEFFIAIIVFTVIYLMLFKVIYDYYKKKTINYVLIIVSIIVYFIMHSSLMSSAIAG